MAVVELEVDGPRNENLRFRPLQRDVRGKFDWTRVGEPEAHRLASQFGGVPIPGQRLVFDDERLTLAIVDPLHDPANAALAEKLKARGFKLPPAREQFDRQDVHTIGFWLAKAVECGLARIVSGELPPAIDPAKARRDFIFAPKPPSTADRLTLAIDRMAEAQQANTEVLAKLLAMLTKK